MSIHYEDSDIMIKRSPQFCYILFIICILVNHGYGQELSHIVSGKVIGNDSIPPSPAEELFLKTDLTDESFKSFLTVPPPQVEEKSGGIPVWVWIGTGLVTGGTITYFVTKKEDTPPTDLPVARDDNLSIPCNGSGTINVLTNDTGDGITVSNTSAVPGVEITHTGGGVISISNVGLESFSFNYTIRDNQNRSSTATVNVTVLTGTILTMDDNFVYDVGGSATGNVLTNDSGDGLMVISNTNTSSGVISISGSGDLIYTPNEGSCGQETVDYTVRDNCGLEASARVFLTSNDNILPIIECPPDMELSIDPGQCSATVSYDITTSDNCPNETISQTAGLPSGSQFPVGETTNSFVVTDANGNTTECSFTIIVYDDLPPTITCPTEITVECSTNLDPEITGQATATDNCTPSNQINFLYNDDTSGLNECNNTGTIIRTWTAIDGLDNQTSCTQIIHIIDSTSPGISCPSDIELPCGSDYSPEITGMPQADDLCGEISLSYEDDLSGVTGCGNTGLILRTWTAEDGCGNQSSCEQFITIAEDTQNPIIECPPDIVIFCGDSIDPLETGSIIATDNCTPEDQIVFIYEDSEPDPTSCTQEILRTWTAVDACGNSTSCTQIITIEDQSAPILSCPVDLTITCMVDPDPETTGSPIVDDDCGQDNITISYEDEFISSGGCGGMIIRDWTAIDNCGNTSTCTQTITVEELPCDFSFATSTFNADCGLNNGLASVDITPGPSAQGPFSVIWSDGQSGNQATGLGPGIYQVSITDQGLNCVQEGVVEIGQDPPNIVSSVELVPISCSGEEGNIIVGINSPGSGPVSVLVFLPGGGVIDIPNFPTISTFFLSEWLPGAPPGQYTFIITDQSMGPSCSQTFTVVLVEEVPPVLSLIAIIPASGPTASDGEFSLNASGVPPFSVFINEIFIGTAPGSDFNITGVPPGEYTVFVIDGQGCISNTLLLFMEFGSGRNTSALQIGLPLQSGSGYFATDSPEMPFALNNSSEMNSYSVQQQIMISSYYPLKNKLKMGLEVSYSNGNWNDTHNLTAGQFELLQLSPHLRWQPQITNSANIFFDLGINYQKSTLRLNAQTASLSPNPTLIDPVSWFGKSGVEFQLSTENLIRLQYETILLDEKWQSFGELQFIRSIPMKKNGIANLGLHQLPFKE